MSQDAFYVGDGDGYVSSELTRGPWSADHQHGGPPAALLVGRLLRAFPEWQAGRVVVDFLRPVPITRLRVELSGPSGGRRVSRAGARLLDADGHAVAQLSALLVKPTPVVPAPPGPHVDRSFPSPPDGEQPPGALARFPFFRSSVGYHTAMDLHFSRGHFGAGPVAVWMRQRVPTVQGETPTPWERVMCVVDSVHGVSWEVDPREMSAINPDLCVAMHREPQGEWVGLDAQTANEPSGTGVAHSRLHDAVGPVGWSTQVVLLSRG